MSQRALVIAASAIALCLGSSALPSPSAAKNGTTYHPDGSYTVCLAGVCRYFDKNGVYQYAYADPDCVFGGCDRQQAKVTPKRAFLDLLLTK